jgi:hypothetical protein
MSSLGVALTVLLGVVGIVCLVALYVFIQQFIEPPFFDGVETRTVEAVIEPGQTVSAKVDVTVDMNEVSVFFDYLTIELALAEPASEAAVFGSFDIEHVGETRPALITDKVDVETLEVPYPCGPEVSQCRIPVEIRLGNVGATPERWVMTASISRSTRDEEEASSFDVPSLDARLTDLEVADGEWVSPGPVAFESSDELVAYELTVDTSVNDPSLFEVVVTEPRQDLVTRSTEVVFGPDDPSWSLVYFEPDPAPVAQQAECTESGCVLHLVAIFRPREGDWWIPIVRPTAEARRDLFHQHTARIEIDRTSVTEISGSLGVQDPSGILTLQIKTDPNSPQAAAKVLVYPKDNFQWAVPQLRTDDGQTPKMYRWFDLDCDAARCTRDVNVTWELVMQQEATELEYWIVAVGGIGGGQASPRPPTVEVNP